MGTDWSKVHTRSGEMDFTESSKAAILKHVEEGWQESLWERDNRGAYEGQDMVVLCRDAHSANYC